MTIERHEPDGLGALPGLVRVGVSALWHTNEWALRTSLRASRRVLGVALAPETAPELIDDVREQTRAFVRNVIEFADLEERLRAAGVAGDVAKKAAEVIAFPGGALAGSERREAQDRGANRNGSVPTLREEGAALLHKSRDVRYDEDEHPAYERILSELAPDEARILRLLVLDGPQPSIDIRTGGPIGMISSRLISPGMTMIGARAGCRYVDRVPSYLNNLFRLGMIWFSRETIRDPLRYQVLEAQPEVIDAAHSVRYAKIVRRSIHLTAFGEDFCRVAFIEDEEPVALPEHSLPPDADKAAQPPALTEGD
jgi:Abortive infection alpha